MKKFISIVLFAVLAISMVSCSDSSDNVGEAEQNIVNQRLLYSRQLPEYD